MCALSLEASPNDKQAGPSGVSAFIFSARTQRSLKATMDEISISLLNSNLPFHPELQTKPHWQPWQLQLISDSPAHKEPVRAPPRSSQAFHTTNPCTILQSSVRPPPCIHRARFPRSSHSRCVCNFFTLDRNSAMTCCLSQRWPTCHFRQTWVFVVALRRVKTLAGAGDQPLVPVQTSSPL